MVLLNGVVFAWLSQDASVENVTSNFNVENGARKAGGFHNRLGHGRRGSAGGVVFIGFPHTAVCLARWCAALAHPCGEPAVLAVITST